MTLNMYENDLSQIVDGVIVKRFPELLGEDIQIEYTKLQDSLLEYGELTDEGYYIEVDETLRSAPREVLTRADRGVSGTDRNGPGPRPD